MSAFIELWVALLACAPATPAATPAPATPPGLRAISVPPQLAAASTNPEPSGVVWSAALDRYLVVSDDTGRRGEGTYHAPWLYAMSRDGALDPSPVPLLGVDSLEDPEAICEGPDRTLFLLTSASPTKKGKQKKGRRKLYQVSLEGRALKVVASVDLGKPRHDEGDALLEAVGLDPSGRRDLEAAAWKDGALYLGFKSPLTGSGRAVIAVVTAPLAALKSGDLRDGAVRRWAEVPLSVAGPAGAVFQGISDMAFLPDGSLALLANSPKGLPPDGGGALWRVPRPGPGVLDAVLVRRYLGSRPEGVTLAPGASALTVVFDQNQETPLWTTEPLPR